MPEFWESDSVVEPADWWKKDAIAGAPVPAAPTFTSTTAPAFFPGREGEGGLYTPRVDPALQPRYTTPRSLWQVLTEGIPFTKLAPTAQTAQDAFDVLAAVGKQARLAARPEPTTPSVQEQLEGPATPPGTAAKITTGAVQAGLTIPETFTSPLGIATAGIGAAGGTAARLTSAGFGVKMLSDVPEKTMDVYEALKLHLGPEEATKRIGELALDVAMTAAMAKHAATPTPAPISDVAPRTAEVLKETATPQPKESYAVQERQAAEVLRDVPQLTGEGAGQVPAQESAQRVPQGVVPETTPAAPGGEPVTKGGEPLEKEKRQEEGNVLIPETAAATSQVSPAAAIPWYESQGEAVKERIFGTIRTIQDRVDQLAKRERALRPPQGQIAIGASGFDEFIRSEAQAEILRAIRKGQTPEQAEVSAKQFAREAVAKHNAKRPKDVDWQRSERTADSTIEWAIGDLREAAKPISPPASDVPAFAARFDRDTLLSRPAWVEVGSTFDKALAQVRENPERGVDVTGVWKTLQPEQRQEIIARGWTVRDTRTPGQVVLGLSNDAIAARKYFAAQTQRTLSPPAVETPAGAPPVADVTANLPATRTQEPAAAVEKIREEVKTVARTDGTRSAKEIKSELVERLEKAVDAAPYNADVIEKTATKPTGERYITQPYSRTKVTIDIPGDGVFTVWNTKEALQGVLDRARKIDTRSNAPERIQTRGVPAEVTEEIRREMAQQRAVEAPESAFYISKYDPQLKTTEFIPVPGKPVEMPGFPQEFFVAKNLTGKGYGVFESRSGQRAGTGGSSPQKAIEAAKKALAEITPEKVEQVIKEAIAVKGESPRRAVATTVPREAEAAPAKPPVTTTTKGESSKRTQFDLLTSVSNKANRKPYVPLTEPELQQLVASGDVYGKGPKKGKLTEQGQNALLEFQRQERVKADEEFKAIMEASRKPLTLKELAEGKRPPGASETGAVNIGAIIDAVYSARDKLKNAWATRENKFAIAAAKDAADTKARITGKQFGNSVRLEAKKEFGDEAAQALRAVGAVIESGGYRARLSQFITQATGKHGEAVAAAQFADANWDRLKPLAALVKQIHDAQIAEENSVGIATEFRENYIKHAFDASKLPNRGAEFFAGGGGTGPGGKFRAARKFDTLYDAIEAGYGDAIITMDASRLVDSRVAAGQRMINDRAWVASFRGVDDPTTSKPIITDAIVDRNGVHIAPPGYDAVPILPGQYVAVHHGYMSIFDAVTGGSRIEQAEIAGLPAGKAVLKTAAGIKHGLLLFDTFHASRIMQKQFFTTGRVGWNKGLSLLEYSDGDLTEAVRQGEITQEMADYARTRRPIAELLISKGLNVGRIQEALRSEIVRNIPGIGTFNRWVFDKVTRGAMMETALREFDRVRANNPGMTPEEAAAKVAKDINVTFGNIGRQGLFKSRTMQDISRIVALAPQWVESMARSELGGFTQLARVPFDAAMGRGLQVGTLGKAMATGLLSYIVATQLMNIASRGHLTFDNPEEEHKLDAWIPDVTGKTPGYFLNPLSVVAELTHDAYRYAWKKETGLDVLKQIAENKASPFSRSVGVLWSGKNFSGQKIEGTWRRIEESGAALIPAPIPVSGVFSDRPSQTQRQITASLGVKTEPASTASQEVQQKASEFLKTKGIKRETPELSEADSYVNLRAAVRNNDVKKAKEIYADLLKTHTEEQIAKAVRDYAERPMTGSKELEKEFLDWLAPQRGDIYDKAREERQALSERIVDVLDLPSVKRRKR